MRALAFAAMIVLSVPPTRASDMAAADQSLVAERLASRAMGVLDGILGPGRATVLVEVRGERLQITSESEIVTPIAQASSSVREVLRSLDLPGYQKERRASSADKPGSGAAPSSLAVQKDFEHSLRDAGFEIKKIEATVILDSALSDVEARDAAQLLPQLLRIDAERGDVLSIMRAPMRPAWKTAFSTPGDWRNLAFAAGGLGGALILVLILAAAFIRGARVFAKELTSRHDRAERLESAMGEPLPELMPGSPAGLVEARFGGDGAPPAPEFALGRRFDYLESSEADASRVLREQPPSDLAQIFAYLSKLAPETASRLFSKLPADVQTDASAAIMKLKAVDPDRLSEIEERLRGLVANALQGSERLAAILSRFPREERAVLLGRLAGREDSRGVEDVERQLFSFEDFSGLSHADLRRVVAAVPHELWGAALRGAPESLLAAVLAELPEGRRGPVREEAGNAQPKDKVLSARSKILDAVLNLAAKGQIRLDQGAGAQETL